MHLFPKGTQSFTVETLARLNASKVLSLYSNSYNCTIMCEHLFVNHVIDSQHANDIAHTIAI